VEGTQHSREEGVGRVVKVVPHLAVDQRVAYCGRLVLVAGHSQEQHRLDLQERPYRMGLDGHTQEVVEPARTGRRDCMDKLAVEGVGHRMDMQHTLGADNLLRDSSL